MLEIAKVLIILLLEIIIFYILGTFFYQICFHGKESRATERTITGFLLLQIIFQMCALPCIFLDTTLTVLTRLWMVVIGVILCGSVLIARNALSSGIKEIIQYIKVHKGVVFFLALVILAVCYYVSINGERNDDSTYYIGLINTTLSMDSMYRFNVYNGFGMESLYARRALATFDIHSAVLCKIFDVHPLILTRYGRANLNVLLTAMATYLMGTKLFSKESSALVEKKACTLVMMVFAANFLFAGNIYTSATFLLTRAYEGKAFAGNVLVVFTLYVCFKLIEEFNKDTVVLLLLILWGCLAISTSAIVVNFVAVILLLVPYYVFQMAKRIKVKSNGKC